MSKKLLFFVTLTVITFYSRFLNLNWDQEYGFHPDENNLWGASRSVKLFSKLDPEFYAYGGFPIYLYSFFERKETARAVSAMLQVAVVALLYGVGVEIGGKRTGATAALTGAVSAGLIQAAHYASVESLLGAFGLIIVWCLLRFSKTSRYRWMTGAFIALGLGIATKVSFAVFALPFLTLFFGPFRASDSRLKRIALLWVGVLGTLGILFLTNPYIFWKWPSIRGTLRYESDVAMGASPVFYTRQFTGTTPGLYQAIHVFPSITSWLFVPAAILGLLRVRKNPVVLLSVLAAVLSFAPLWVKWTRYVVQVLPILVIPAAGLIGSIGHRRLRSFVVAGFILSFLPSFFGIVRVYSSRDTRLTAAQWAATHVPKGAPMFTEAMEIGIVPFNPVHGSTITLMNFYDLDVDQTGELQQKLDTLVTGSQFFISPSTRVWRHVLDDPDRYPKAAAFYRSLFDGSLGFTKVYDSSPNPFTLYASRLTQFRPEETFEVFDNPRVLIFKKQ